MGFSCFQPQAAEAAAVKARWVFANWQLPPVLSPHTVLALPEGINVFPKTYLNRWPRLNKRASDNIPSGHPWSQEHSRRIGEEVADICRYEEGT